MNTEARQLGTRIEIPAEALDDEHLETNMSFDEENMEEIETTHHNIPHATHFPRNDLTHRNERSRPFFHRVDYVLESCCLPCVQAICRNKLGFFFAVQGVILFIKLIKFIDQFIPGWIFLMPIMLFIFLLGIRACRKYIIRHRPAVRGVRRRHERDANQLVQEMILQNLRYRLEAMMAATERMRQYRRQRGMSEDEINDIPVEQYAKTPGAEEEDVCSICIEEFKQEQGLRKLTCGHRFHQCCIDQWLKQSASCPNCKTELKTQDFNDFDAAFDDF